MPTLNRIAWTMTALLALTVGCPSTVPDPLQSPGGSSNGNSTNDNPTDGNPTNTDPPAPPSEAGLAGDWRVNNSPVFLSFNDSGVPSAAYVENNPERVDITGATVSVSGNDVRFTIPTDAGGAVFTGSFQDEGLRLAGTLDATISITGDTFSASIPPGTLLLTR